MTSVPTAKMLINGEFVESDTSHFQDVINPATQEVLAQVANQSGMTSCQERRVMKCSMKQISNPSMCLFVHTVRINSLGVKFIGANLKTLPPLG